jgi:hypothetical protein
MHPHAFGIDAVCKTNNLKKGMSTFAILDGNNCAVQVGHFYIPSGKKWIYSLLLVNFLPMIWGEQICK